MKMKKAIIVLLLLAILPLVLGAEDEVHIIDDPVDDDLILSGETIVINARVDGDVFLTAGSVEINAPINGDAFVAGGVVTIDGEVGEDIIVAGSQVQINQNVGGKVIAAGGTVDLDAEVAEKIIMAGGNIRLSSGSKVGGKAYVIGGQVVNAGDIDDTLTVRASTFRNSGTAGEVDHVTWDAPDLKMGDFSEFFGFAAFVAFVLGVLVMLGFLVAGILLLRYFPRQFLAVESEVRGSPLRNIVMGFILLIATGLILVVLMITVIGIPTAIILGLLSTIAVLTSGMFVALALGRWIGSVLNIKTGDTWLYVIGWFVLSVLFFVPIIGAISTAVVVCLGYGSIYYALRNNWDALRGESAQPVAV
jgi:hypothetical protein